MARENPTWGLRSPPGCSRQSRPQDLRLNRCANILRDHGLEPVRERRRQTTWHAFLNAHWDVLAAIDFTTIEVWTKGGFVTYYLLFVMELASRRVQLAGCTGHPTEAWMMQEGRNLTDPLDGFLRHVCGQGTFQPLLAGRPTNPSGAATSPLKCYLMQTNSTANPA